MEHEECDKPQQQEKHLSLNSAINNLERIRCNVQNLLHRIVSGPAPPEGKAVDEAVPTLSDMLEKAPERIDKECETINGTLVSIESALF